MNAAVHHFAHDDGPARRLAEALGLPVHAIAHRRFPDGESLVQVEPGGGEGTALLYCPLDDPDARIMPLLLAASALRDQGAARLVLVAPYLGYMRQDCAFAPGQAVSQRVIGGLIAQAFDGLATVDPHLHRTSSLDAVVPGITALNLSAAPAIAGAIAAMVTPDTVLVGPDAESRPWVQSVAAPAGLDLIVGTKQRRGDRAVEITLEEAGKVAGRPALLVDDVISSGGTLIACAKALRAAGATSIGAVASHCLASEADLAALAAAGIAPVLACDSVPGPVATIPLAPVLAAAIRQSLL